jgi:hypothetical protein
MSENIPYIIAENGYYYVAYKEKVKVPELTVSAKGVANGLSEEYNDGYDFGPDSYSPTSTSAIPYTETVGWQEAVNYAQKTNNTIKGLSGTYIINTGISIPSNIRIIGSGYTTIFQESDSFVPLDNNQAAVFNFVGSDTISNVEISGFEILSSSGLGAVYEHVCPLSHIKIHDIYNIGGNGANIFFEGLGSYGRSSDIEIYNIESHNIASIALYSNGIYGYQNIDIHDILDVVDADVTDDRIAVLINNAGVTQTADITVRNVTVSNTFLYIRESASGTVNGFKLDAGSYTSGYYNVYDNLILNNVHIYVDNVTGTLSGNSIVFLNSPLLHNVTLNNVNVISKTTQFYSWMFLTFAYPHTLKIHNFNVRGGSVDAYHGLIDLFMSNLPSSLDYVEIDSVYAEGVSGGDFSGIIFIDNSGGAESNPNLVVGKNIWANYNGTGNSILLAGYDESGTALECTSQVILENIYTNGNVYNISSGSSVNLIMKNIKNFGNIINTPTTPSVPASGTAQQNTNPYPVKVYVNGGALTELQITIGGTAYTVYSNSTASAVYEGFTLPIGASITLTYSTAPTWEWVPE